MAEEAWLHTPLFAWPSIPAQEILEGSERFQPAGAFRDTDLREVFTIVSPCAAEYREPSEPLNASVCCWTTDQSRPHERNGSTVSTLLPISERGPRICRTTFNSISRHRKISCRGAYRAALSLPGSPLPMSRATFNQEQRGLSPKRSNMLWGIYGHSYVIARIMPRQNAGLDCIDTPRTYRGELPRVPWTGNW